MDAGFESLEVARRSAGNRHLDIIIKIIGMLMKAVFVASEVVVVYEKLVLDKAVISALRTEIMKSTMFVIWVTSQGLIFIVTMVHRAIV